jgi:DNA-binding SARP family transcriptional activator
MPYAKLTPPRISAAIARPRLWARLDALRKEHAVIWLAGPPGAGKSQLLASYLHARGCPTLWYQLDRGDVEAVTIVHYLQSGMAVLGRTGVPGPANWDEAGTRAYFRALFDAMPAACCLVLDNAHEYEWHEGGQMLRIAMEELPAGRHLLLAGRTDPPLQLARLQMEGKLALLGAPELRLDEIEAATFLEQRDVAECGAEWRERLCGWVAGFALLARAAAHTSDWDGPAQAAIDDYFAGVVLDRLPPPQRTALLRIACIAPARGALPLVLDDEQLALLHTLAQRHLFVERSGDDVALHPLFLTFLRAKARQTFDAAQRQAALADTAAQLERSGRWPMALPYYQAAESWPALAALLERVADDYLGAGQQRAWLALAQALPPALAATPWLTYWRARACQESAPLQAQRLLQALATAATGEPLLRLHAWAALVDLAHDCGGEPALLAEARQALQAGLAAAPEAGWPAETELFLASRYLLACMMEGSNGGTPAAAQRVAGLLLAATPAARLAAARILWRHYAALGESQALEWLRQAMADVIADAALAGSERSHWLVLVVGHFAQQGRHALARPELEAAQALIQASAAESVHVQMLAIHESLAAGDYAQAEAAIEQLCGRLAPAQLRFRMELLELQAHCNAGRGQFGRAAEHASTAALICGKAGGLVTEYARLAQLAGLCAALAGRFVCALHWSGEAARLAEGARKALAQEAAHSVAAYVHIQAGRQAAARAALRQAMDSLLARDAEEWLPGYEPLVAPLAAEALDMGLAPDWVRGLIVRQRLAPPHRLAFGWPWPLAVTSFGGVQLHMHGRPVPPSGKQQRPFELLQALVAAGPAGRNQTTLGAELWPDALDCKSALNITVHRLRKMLGSDAAVRVGGGRVALAEEVVWTDVQALTALLARLETGAGLTPDAAAVLAEQLLRIYRGPFCDGEEVAWILLQQDRFRARFLQAAQTIGQVLEQHAQWEAARRLYVRALEAEPLAEVFYRGLMRVTHALGDSAAAYSALRRCREMLSILLGRRPTAETERLAGDLGFA